MSQGISFYIQPDGNGTNKLIELVVKLADSADKAADSETKLSKAIKKQGDEAKGAANDTQQLSKALSATGSAYSAFGSIVGGLASVFSAAKVLQYAESYGKVENQLKLVTRTQTELNRTTNEAFNIARRTGTNVEAVANSYAGFTRVLRGMNQDVSLAGPLTETLNKAIQLTNPSAEAAASGVLQFSQAMGKGVLNGDELTAILENTPGLALALAEGLRVPIGALKEMGEAGTLTGQKLVEALTKSSDIINQVSATQTKSIASAWQNLNTSLTQYIGQADKAGGFSQMLVKAINLLANNLQIVIPALTIVAGLFAAMAVIGAISSVLNFASSMLNLAKNAALAAAALGSTFMVPLAAVGVAVLAAMALMKLFGISFDDVGNAIVNYVKRMAGIKPATDQANSGLMSSEQVMQRLKEAAAAGLPVWNPLINVIKKTGEASTQASSEINASSVSIEKAGQNVGKIRVYANEASDSFRDVAVSASATQGGFRDAATAAGTANSGFLEVSETMNRFPTSSQAVANGSTAASAALLAQERAAKLLATQVTLTTAAQYAQQQEEMLGAAATAQGVLATTNASNAEAIRVGWLQQLGQWLATIFGLETQTVAATTASTVATNDNAAANEKNSTANDIMAKAMEQVRTLLGDIPGGMGKASKATEDAAKASSALEKEMKTVSKAAEDEKQSLDKLRQSLSQAVEANDNLTKSLTETGAAFATSTERVDYFSNILMNDYSSAAATAAQKAATLAENIRGSGSAAAMAASQYQSAASAADDYATSAANAANAASIAERNFGSQNPYSSGGTKIPGGTSVNANESFALQWDGMDITTRMKYDVGPQTGYRIGTEQYGTEIELLQLKERQKRLDLLKERFPDLTGQQALNIEMTPDLWARYMNMYDQQKLDKQKGNSLYGGTGGSVPAFANGGSFQVGGNGGTDSQFVKFWASPDETVHVMTPAQQREMEQDNRQAPRRNGGFNIKNLNIVTKDSDGFRRTKRQTYRDFARQLSKAV